MNKSRRKFSRKQIQRRRKWHERRKRRESLQASHEAFLKKFSFRYFVRDNRLQFFLVMLALAGVIGMLVLLTSRKSVPEAVQTVLETLAQEQAPQWAQKYSQGYKLIVITNDEIIHTDYDHLPDKLQVDWKELIVKKLKADQLKNMPERIRIQLSGLSYAPTGISGITITSTFTRQKGMIGSFLKFNGLELVAEIIEDQGNMIFCLLGLRQINQ